LPSPRRAGDLDPDRSPPDVFILLAGLSQFRGDFALGESASGLSATSML
jgi:hypothetical protein